MIGSHRRITWKRNEFLGDYGERVGDQRLGQVEQTPAKPEKKMSDRQWQEFSRLADRSMNHIKQQSAATTASYRFPGVDTGRSNSMRNPSRSVTGSAASKTPESTVSEEDSRAQPDDDATGASRPKRGCTQSGFGTRARWFDSRMAEQLDRTPMNPTIVRHSNPQSITRIKMRKASHTRRRKLDPERATTKRSAH